MISDSDAPRSRRQLFRRKPRWKEAFAHLAAVVLLVIGFSSVSAGQRHPSITVRVLNAKDGRPLSGVLLLAYAPAKKPNVARTEQERLLASATTDGDGSAALRLPDRISEVIISYGDLFVGRCTPWSAFLTAKILKRGVVARNTCSGGKFEYAAAPKPGELVLFAKKWSWWERMKHSE